MSETIEPSFGDSRNIIEKFDQITNEDIASVRNKILPECLEEFDSLNQETKMRFALLNKLSPSEIKQILTAGYLPGLHNIKNELTKYYLLTNQ
ncbi:MAG: hypothetical protein COU29_01725 [Candidatus Magasanikbacteria bacterium CG10_big_fil_rev_8_21_14_0_10_36_32]|uniref:Uncharacterized protein n=1 Tax=Candidatus Magasanikbacteria bacterium CG10_big_fil_rev_8_21_14_0_10_36_32 TaxID=1974646 RepID=A0A2M6W6S6_9BACT|nr:MAG: hypothetical protein COU29_01725 [Candidatus Magasanikbacteria bacterium CG10_big_fil_rev_8_21_14_0_10_36_32]